MHPFQCALTQNALTLGRPHTSSALRGHLLGGHAGVVHRGAAADVPRVLQAQARARARRGSTVEHSGMGCSSYI